MPTLELNGKLFAEQSGTGPVKLKIDELTESTANAGIRLTHPLKSSAGDDIMTADGALHNINFDNVANSAIHVNKLNIPNDTISGDKVHGGSISNSILDTSIVFPVGHVLNTKYNRTNNAVSLSGGQWTDTGLNISHATLSGSYVLIFGYVVVNHGYTADNSLRLRIMMNSSTEIFNDNGPTEYGNGDGNESYTFKMFFNYLYNPGNTNNNNYRIDVNSSSGAVAQNSSAYSTITLLEIKQ